ncbi:MAG: ABC transporter permease [Gammaproteobacteria bacterium]|nr:ABC transporter permease [Gammaproteobacteria bacterium]
MTWNDTLRTAVFALRGNWMRSTLTSLGVIIGIAAVIVMVSVGQGTQAEIDKMVSGLGANRLDISSGAPSTGGIRGGAGSQQTLTDGDALAIREQIPEVQYVAAGTRGNAQIVYAENNWSTSWQGVQPDFFEINGWKIGAGAGLEPGDYTSAAKVVVIGETIRRELFGEEDPLGQSLRIGKVPFRVVGVLSPKGQGGFGQDQDDVIMVPLETARRRLTGASGAPPGTVRQIALGVTRSEDLSFVQEEVEALLRERHKIAAGAEDDFSVRNISEIVATRTQTTRIMSLLLGAVAGISLIVGGIGIMNIMLVSVTERIREIGLRMAVGAGPRDIQRQFLTEAMLISFGGGIIGTLIGIAGALLAGKLGSLPVLLDWHVVALAAGCSVATGLFFGFYPARKAAQLDPIEALRHQG